MVAAFLRSGSLAIATGERSIFFPPLAPSRLGPPIIAAAFFPLSCRNDFRFPARENIRRRIRIGDWPPAENLNTIWSWSMAATKNTRVRACFRSVVPPGRLDATPHGTSRPAPHRARQYRAAGAAPTLTGTKLVSLEAIPSWLDIALASGRLNRAAGTFSLFRRRTRPSPSPIKPSFLHPHAPRSAALTMSSATSRAAFAPSTADLCRPSKRPRASSWPSPVRGTLHVASMCANKRKKTFAGRTRELVRPTELPP